MTKRDRSTRVDPTLPEYRKPPPTETPAEIEAEAPLAPPPEPHAIQREALTALEGHAREGNPAGLVVLATGLGKTWLSAFDSVRFGASACSSSPTARRSCVRP